MSLKKRRNSYRKLNHDYGGNYSYFITMCVKNRVKCLSRITLNKETNQPILQLSKYGILVEKQLIWLCERYEYVLIPCYVIMPDHIHFIIEIDSHKKLEQTIKVKPMSELMGAFKSTTSKLIHLEGNIEFTWLRNYYDKIILSYRMKENVKYYINRNPRNWIFGKKK
jgi:putative transposase